MSQGHAESRTPATQWLQQGCTHGQRALQCRARARLPTSWWLCAASDPFSGNLDRIQIVKGWLDSGGELHEKVHDVVWGDADTRSPGADGKLPAVGSTVDIENATWTNTIGDPELITVWTDPDFDPDERAFYYARVLEIPTPRWTAYDAKRFGVDPLPGTRLTIQERAYTAPIWFTPAQ